MLLKIILAGTSYLRVNLDELATFFVDSGRKTRRQVSGALNYENYGQKRSRMEEEGQIDVPDADLFD